MKLISGELTEQVEIFQRTLKEAKDGSMTFRWKAQGKVWAKIENYGQSGYMMTVRKGAPFFQHFKWHHKMWKVIGSVESMQQEASVKIQFKLVEEGDE